MRILAIDPGTAISGYALIDVQKGELVPVTWGAIRTNSREDMPSRLLRVHRAIQELIECHAPSVLAVEQLYFNRNTTSALAVGQARGIVLLAGAMHGLTVREFTPSQVKQAVTGLGRATKQQVGFMVKALLKLDELPTPNDVTDAMAVGICCAHSSPALERDASHAASGASGSRARWRGGALG